jgi:hypothetical protein
MNREKRGYLSFLLRLWQMKSGGDLVWRGSLQCPRSGKYRGFASPADLFTFLETLVRGDAENEMVGNPHKGGGGDHC